MLNKTKIAEEFLKSLENKDTTFNIMLDRIDIETLKAIHNYADLISKSKIKQILMIMNLWHVQ